MVKVHPNINPLVLHVKGAVGPAFTGANRNLTLSSPVRSDRNQIRPSPDLASVAYLGRPWCQQGGQRRGVHSHLSPSFKASPAPPSHSLLPRMSGTTVGS